MTVNSSDVFLHDSKAFARLTGNRMGTAEFFFRKYSASQLFGFSVLLYSSLAIADHESIDYYDLSLDELLNVKVDVVSAFSETPVKAAASVSHLEASEWQSFGALRTSDALSVLPGVMIYPSTGDFIAIRGYGQILSRRGIATLIDGVSVNDFAFGSSQVSMEHISLGVLDSLDLIRGPGSVQYGTDAFHGVVSLNTYYREKNDNQLRLSAGTHGEARGAWQFSQQFADGHFFNAALDKFDQNDDEREQWVYGTNGRYSPGVSLFETERAEDTDVGSALLKWHNSHNDELFYQFSILHNETDFSNFPGGGSSLGFRTEDTVGNDSRNDVYRLELEQVIDPRWRIGGFAYYTDLERDIEFQTTSLIGSTYNDIHKHGSQLYAKYVSADETLRLFTGVEYSYQSIDDSYTRSFADNGVLQAVLPGADDGLSRRVESYLLQARKDFSVIEIEAGVRHDNYSDFGENTTPRIAFIKQFPDQQTVKLIYANAFRAAVSAEMQGSAIVRGDSNIDPETLDSYELVYSRKFKSAFVQMTLFDTHWKDGITIVPLIPPQPPFNSAYTNIAESKSHGAEFIVNYQSGHWLYSTDITYTESEDEYRDIDYSAFPRYIWNARINYSMTPKTSWHITQRVRHDMTSGHNNFSSTGVDLNEDLPTYWRIDLGIKHEFTSSVAGELVLNNIFDRENWVPSVYNSPNGIIDDSFSILATLALSF